MKPTKTITELKSFSIQPTETVYRSEPTGRLGDFIDRAKLLQDLSGMALQVGEAIADFALAYPLFSDPKQNKQGAKEWVKEFTDYSRRVGNLLTYSCWRNEDEATAFDLPDGSLLTVSQVQGGVLFCFDSASSAPVPKLAVALLESKEVEIKTYTISDVIGRLADLQAEFGDLPVAIVNYHSDFQDDPIESILSAIKMEDSEGDAYILIGGESH